VLVINGPIEGESLSSGIIEVENLDHSFGNLKAVDRIKEAFRAKESGRIRGKIAVEIRK